MVHKLKPRALIINTEVPTSCGFFLQVDFLKFTRTITNLRFADDIDALAGKEDELVKLINHLDTTSTKYGMEISAEKTKLMTNNT